MDVKKFQLAMRPKKYLTHDFIVYQDPSMQATRSEMQAGGIVQREGFSKGSSFKLNKNTAKKLKKTLPKGVGLSYNSKTNTWTIEGNISKDGKKVYREFISNPTEQQILNFVDQYKVARKKILPNEITTGKFQELRLSDEYVDLTDQQFADVLNKQGYKTVQQYKNFTRENVKNYQKSLGITDQVGKTASPKRTMDEVKKIIKEAPGGNIVLKEFKGNESYLRKYANSLVKQKKANLAYSFPLGNTKEQIMWKNFYNSSQRGDRITIGGTFNGKDLSDPTNWPRDKDGKINWQLKDKDGVQAWKNMTFTDNQAPNKPKTFYWNSKQGDLKNQIDATFGKGFFERNTRAYDQQSLGRKQTITIDGKPKNINQFIAEQMIIKDFQAIPGNENKLPSKEYVNSKIKNYNFQEAHHPEGIGKNPYKVELASRDANRKLGLLEAQRVRGVITDNEFKKQAQAISDEFGGIRYKVGSKFIGKKGTPQTILTSIKNQFQNNPQMFQLAESAFGDVCRIKKSTGGRVPGEDYNTCIARNLNETIGDATNVSDKAKSGKAINKLSELTNLAKAAKYGKGALRGLQAILVGTGVGEIALTAALEGLGPIEGAVEGEDLTRIISRAPLVNLALNAFGFEDFSEENLKKIVYGSGLEGAELAGAEKLVKQFDRANTLSDLFGKKQRTLDYENLLIDEGTGYVGMMNDKIAEIDKQIQQTSEDFGRPENQIKRDDVLFLKKGIENYASKSADRIQSSYLGKTGTSGYGAMGEQPYILGDTEFVGDEFFPTKSREQIKAELQQKRTADVLENRAGFGFMEDIIEDVAGPGKADLSLQETFQYDPNAILGYSGGGVVKRKGFANGPKIGRRGFLGMLAAVVASLKVGSFGSTGKKVTSEVAKKVIKDAPTGTPDWFAPLVDKVFREGVDAGETMKTVSGRETVKKLEVQNPETNTTEKYFLYENPDTGEIRIDIDAPFLGANDGEFSLYMRPNKIDGINDDGTPMMDEGEFFVTEERAVGRMNGPDDFDIELETIDTDLSGSASDYHRVEEFATGKTNKKAQEEQLKKKDYIERNPGDDIESRYGPFNDTPPDDDY